MPGMFTRAEHADIVFVYGYCDGNGRGAAAECPRRWIGRGGPVPWPTRSPDLCPSDFLFWSSLNSRVCIGRRSYTLDKLLQAISDATDQLRNELAGMQWQHAMVGYKVSQPVYGQMVHILNSSCETLNMNKVICIKDIHFQNSAGTPSTSRTCLHNKLHIMKENGSGASCDDRLYIGHHENTYRSYAANTAVCALLEIKCNRFWQPLLLSCLSPIYGATYARGALRMARKFRRLLRDMQSVGQEAVHGEIPDVPVHKGLRSLACGSLNLQNSPIPSDDRRDFKGSQSLLAELAKSRTDRRTKVAYVADSLSTRVFCTPVKRRSASWLDSRKGVRTKLLMEIPRTPRENNEKPHNTGKLRGVKTGNA
ncbi:hypothetical protein PR048_030308 [Dryococelus australis]|uniref:Uncharacterized protein n=1 Tax=Dryococelus australis TaxID=614101 RepID=A0ABQ9GBI1_9NEOP|nr:hypothetical protein PR048_030308 [Dryococelus australis]